MEDRADDLYQDSLISIRGFQDLCRIFGITRRECANAIRNALQKKEDEFDISNVRIVIVRLVRPPQYTIRFQSNNIQYRNGVNIGDRSDEYLFPLNIFAEEFDQGAGFPRLRRR